MSEILLKIDDLSIEYRTDLETVKAVNNISLDVKSGRTLGIVGETGAGKSTTCLSILRLLPERTAKITGGTISFRGQDLYALTDEEMRTQICGEKISMIFQDPMTSLNPVMTVGAQIYEALKYHNKEKRPKEELEKRVDEVLELVGIPAERKTEYPHQFSGGMKQRVVIAIALACEPELLIADEPTTALDVTVQAQVLAMMRDLQKKVGSAILLITHDLGVVAQMCDDALVMYAGEIVESGAIEDIFSPKEHHPYTLGLFGAIPDLDSAADRLKPIEGLMPDPTKLPEGCYFADRCPYMTPECEKNHPSRAHLSDTHTILCNRFSDQIHKEESHE